MNKILSISFITLLAPLSLIVNAQSPASGVVCTPYVINGQTTMRCISGTPRTYNRPTSPDIPPLNGTVPVLTPPAPPPAPTPTPYTAPVPPADVSVQPYVNSNVSVRTLGPGTVTAIPFDVTNQMLGRTILFSVVETVSTHSGADIQFSVSEYPGDLSKPSPCQAHTQYTGGAIRASVGPKPASTLWYESICELPANTRTIYFNFRHILRPTPNPPDGPGIPSCSDGCMVFVNIN